MTKYGMAIDMNRCVGCNLCSMACRAEHNLPNDVLYSKAVSVGGEHFRTPSGKFPNVKMRFYTLACQHCDTPACVSVCPTGASYKREKDGLVLVDTQKCIGCKSCIAACPYNGVRTLLPGELSYPVAFALGDWAVPEHIPNTVEKCTMCVERIDRGERPRCVDLCTPRARFWGDLDDASSEISTVLKTRKYEQLMTEQGTGPNVYFLV